MRFFDQARQAAGEWTQADVADALQDVLLGEHVAPVVLRSVLCSDQIISATNSPNPVLEFLRDGGQPAWLRRPCHKGPPGHAAMPARLRRKNVWCKGPAPSLKRCCKMCEAEFANKQALLDHVGLVHGGERWYASAVASLVSLEPYISSPVEQRACLERFAHAQQHSTLDPENAPYCEPLEPQSQRHLFYDRLCEACARSTCFLLAFVDLLSRRLVQR